MSYIYLQNDKEVYYDDPNRHVLYGPIPLGQDDLVVVDHGYDDVLVVSINEKVPQHGQHLCNDVLQGLQVEGIG